MSIGQRALGGARKRQRRKRALGSAKTKRPGARRRRFEQLEPRLVLAAEFQLLALIYPEIEDSGQTVSIDEPTLDALVRGAQIELPALVNQLAGDLLQVRVHTEVVDRVLQARPDGLVFDALVEPDLNQFTRSGWYDHVLVLHGQLAGGFKGACCAFPRPGMTMSTVSVSPTSGVLHHGDVPGMLHEWMHALDYYFFDLGRAPAGLDGAGNPLRIHSAETFGYRPDTESRPEWSEWYADYLTGHIRDFNKNGVDTGLGFGPTAFAHQTPRAAVPLTPGGPLERSDVSNSRVTRLSEVHWALAETEWGQIRRNATVDNNPIFINGVGYDDGVGIHANGRIVVNLRGRAERFQADIGVDDDTPPSAGSVVFKVFGDERLLYQSNVLTGADDALHIDVDTVGVNQLRLEVTSAGDGITSDHAVWANARFLPFTGAFISDVGWSKSSSGLGVIHLDKTENRNFITIGGNQYGKGVGAHADNVIDIPLHGRFTSFSAHVGIADEVSSGGSAVFQVYVDGQLAYSSGAVTAFDSARPLQVDVTGVDVLRLAVNGAGNGTAGDNAVWANAFLTSLNRPPTLDPIANPPAIDVNATGQTVALSGISPGDGETQPLRITAVSNNTALIPHPSVSYAPLAATAVLTYMPAPGASGAATVIVEVRDPGLDGDFDNADDAAVTQSFVVFVNQNNDWRNPNNRFDVNNDGFVAPDDALSVINTLIQLGSRPLTGSGGPPYYDVNGDGSVAPDDVLAIINEMRRQIFPAQIAAEGESAIAAGSFHHLALAIHQPATSHAPPARAARDHAVDKFFRTAFQPSAADAPRHISYRSPTPLPVSPGTFSSTARRQSLAVDRLPPEPPPFDKPLALDRDNDAEERTGSAVGVVLTKQ